MEIVIECTSLVIICPRIYKNTLKNKRRNHGKCLNGNVMLRLTIWDKPHHSGVICSESKSVM